MNIRNSTTSFKAEGGSVKNLHREHNTAENMYFYSLIICLKISSYVLIFHTIKNNPTTINSFHTENSQQINKGVDVVLKYAACYVN